LKRSDVLRRLKTFRLPLVGIIAAGSPLENQQQFETINVRLPHDIDPRQYFVVRVSGDSLTGVGIRHGDYAVCRRAQEARNGQLCAVLTPDGVTLKHVIFQRRCVELVSANPRYEPMAYRHDDVSIQGIVVSIERD
jgi:SOS-response transcriptional repressor LexA